MNRPACRAVDDHTTEKAVGFHARPDLQEALHRNPLGSAPRFEIEFGLKAYQRGHEIGGRELRGAQISSDGGDLTNSGIGRTAGGLRKRPAFRQGCKGGRQFGVGDARSNSDLVIENFDVPQFIDF